jgi:hypothetical protein
MDANAFNPTLPGIVDLSETACVKAAGSSSIVK